MDDAAVAKKQPISTEVFVLRRDAADPIHGLFHPDLHLLRGRDLGAVFVPEDQHKFIHFFCFTVLEFIVITKTNERARIGQPFSLFR
jgi:hypothetical protein